MLWSVVRGFAAIVAIACLLLAGIRVGDGDFAAALQVLLGMAVVLDLAFGRLAHAGPPLPDAGGGPRLSPWRLLIFGACGLTLILAGAFAVA